MALDNITSIDVRKWFNQVNADSKEPWPEPPAHYVQAIATACNQELYRIAAEASFAHQQKLAAFARVKALRNAANTIIDELKHLIPELEEEWSLKRQKPSDFKEAVRRLQSWQLETKRARDVLDSVQPSGGQSKPHVDFACRLARHICCWLETRKTPYSLYSQGPLMQFIGLCLDKVFTEKPDLNLESLARAIARNISDS